MKKKTVRYPEEILDGMDKILERYDVSESALYRFALESFVLQTDPNHNEPTQEYWDVMNALGDDYTTPERFAEYLEVIKGTAEGHQSDSVKIDSILGIVNQVLGE